jgi:hypothetical protein
MIGPVDPVVSKHRRGFSRRFKQSRQLVVGMLSPTIKVLPSCKASVNNSLSEVAARPFLQASSVYCCKNLKYRKKELSQTNILFK